MFDQVHQHPSQLGAYCRLFAFTQIFDLLNQVFEIEFIESTLPQEFGGMHRPFDKIRVVQRFRYDIHEANYTGAMALAKYAIGCVLALPVLAQSTGSVEGSVTNSLTRAGIGGITVSITGRAASRTTTDAAGAFRLDGLDPGEYVVQFETSDFMPPPMRPVRVTAEGKGPHVDVELTAWAKIAGRVVDGEGRPAARVQVEMGRLHGGGGSIAGTDDQGRFLIRGMGPGTYVLMARPILTGSAAAEGRPQRVSGLSPRPEDGEPTVWAPTYFPNATDYREAQPIIVRGGAELSGYDIRLTAVPVHRVRGAVFDPDGQPAPAAIVKLVATDLFHNAEAAVKSGDDGSFEFHAVRPGSWQVVAELPQGRTKWRWVGDVTVARRDIDDLKIRLAAPFVLHGFVDRDEPRDSKGNRKLTAVYLVPPGGGPEAQVGGFHKQDGTLVLEGVLPGRYMIRPAGVTPGYYVDSIKLGEQEVLGREVELTPASPPIRVTFKPNAARVRGSVENCEGATIVLIPQDEAFLDDQFIRKSTCDAAGKFEVGGLRPGDYYAFAFDRIDGWALTEPMFMRAFVTRAERVHLGPGEVASLELKVTAWPE